MIKVRLLLSNKREDAAAQNVLIEKIDFLASQGIVLDQAGLDQETDLTLCHQSFLKDELLDHGPVMVLERMAGTVMSDEVRKHLDHPNLKLVMRSAMLDDLETYNEVEGRYHEAILRKTYYGTSPEAPRRHELTNLSKLHFGFSLAAMKPTPLTETSSERPIDIFFAGSVSYRNENKLVSRHRADCLAAIRSLTGKKILCAEGPNALSLSRYHRKMAASKIAVSPWGWGETCYRDYEAVLLGCEVIKPISDHVVDASKIFPGNNLFHWSKPDFSNLPELVDEILSDKRTASPEAHVEACKKIKTERDDLGQHLVKLMKEALDA